MHWTTQIEKHERSVFSQNGEDGVIEFIFSSIGTTNKEYVEFGCDGGHECQARYLTECCGWHGLLMDGGDWGDSVKKEFVTAENVNALFRKYGVDQEPDLLSIDIDGNDYWVRKAIVDYRPRLIVHDYNGLFKPPISVTIAYDPQFIWPGNDYASASLAALVKLNKVMGYTLVYCERRGVNAFFLRNDLLDVEVPSMEELWRPLDIPPRDPIHEWRRRWVEVVLDERGLVERFLEPTPWLVDHQFRKMLPYTMTEQI